MGKKIKLTYNDRRYVANLPNIHEAITSVFQAKTIYLRFDALCRLIDSCNDHLSQATQPDQKIVSLCDRSLKMAMSIVDTHDNQAFNEKRKLREKYSKLDGDYMPWKPPYNREDILNVESRKDYLKRSWQAHSNNLANRKYLFLDPLNYIVDRNDKVRYLNKEEREKHRTFPCKSKLMRFRFSHPPTPLDPNPSPYTSLYLENFDTKDMFEHAIPGGAIFCVTPKGDIFAGSSIACKFYHSSMVSGAAVWFAGVYNVRFGEVKEISNGSGHYMPDRPDLMRVLDYFNDCRLLNKNTNIFCKLLPSKVKEKVNYQVRKKRVVDESSKLKL